MDENIDLQVKTNSPRAKAIYNNSATRRRHDIPLIFALVILLILGALLYLAYKKVLPDLVNFGPAFFWTAGKYYIIGILVCIFLFFLFIILSIPPLKKSVEINENAIIHLKGSQLRHISWDEIKSLVINLSQKYFLFFPTRQNKRVILKDSEGTIIKIDQSIEPFDKLLRSIRRITFDQLINQTLLDFNESKTLLFGLIEINKETGLQLNRKPQIIEELSSVNISNGFLIFHTKGKKKKIKIPIKKIANLDLLLAILKYQGIPTQPEN